MNSLGNEQINNAGKLEDDDFSEVIKECNSINKVDNNLDSPVDNKSSLKQRDKLVTEMMDHLTNSEMECEKLKIQVTDLKMELKICRQKIGALEAELAEAKSKESELTVLLEQHRNNTNKLADPSDPSNIDLILMRNKEMELKSENEDLKLIIKNLEMNLKEIQKKDLKLTDDLKSHTQISRIGEVMEKSMSRVMAESEQAKKERDIAQMHLANAESAFSDVHQKYENCKLQVQVLKNSDESLRRDIAVNEDTIQKQEQKYEALKSFAMGQVEKYNQELITMKRTYDGEIARITAQMKRYEIKSNSLMEALQQKSKECEQLAAVYDEMIESLVFSRPRTTSSVTILAGTSLP